MYSEMKTKLGQRTSRKIGNNTYLKLRSNGSIAVMLHQTDVVTYHRDGTIELNSGGWYTMTTFRRINAYMPSDVSTSNRRGVRYIVAWDNKKEHWNEIGQYFDGILIYDNGRIANQRKVA